MIWPTPPSGLSGGAVKVADRAEIARRARGRVLVAGMGVSGRAAAALVEAQGGTVVTWDARLPATGGRAHVSGPTPPPEAFADVDLVVLSPGVPPERVLPQVVRHRASAPVTGEFSLGLAVLFERRPEAQVVLVTGTNGKSTTTSILATLLVAAGRSVFAGGNLGTPLSAHLAQADPLHGDTYVLECSSFQLETYPGAPVRAAVITNLAPDHLDRYRSFAEYVRTKRRVFAGLTPDGLAAVGASVPDAARPPACVRSVVAVERGAEGADFHLACGLSVPGRRFSLRGRHNRENARLALEVAADLGVDPGVLAEGLGEVEPLPHRCVPVGTVDGITFLDDSKATNVASAAAAAEGLCGPFVLIAGGKAKGEPLDPLLLAVAGRARAVVLTGESAPRWAPLFRPVAPTVVAACMDEAVAAARAVAHPGDTVLLAPAAASYDRYRDFVERGRDFARAVRRLAGSGEAP